MHSTDQQILTMIGAICGDKKDQAMVANPSHNPSFSPQFNGGKGMTLAQLQQISNNKAKMEAKMEEDIILSTCQITGKIGNYGTDIRAARLIVERNGIKESFRMLIHKSIKSGRRFKGGSIKSVTRKGMRASIKKMGPDSALYPVITG